MNMQNLCRELHSIELIYTLFRTRLQSKFRL
nr:MAG TPA: hypothetical protein [Bacteriophage sp.]